MKKIFAIILALITVMGASSAFAADVKVLVNGEEVSFDRGPVVEGDVIMIPYRFVAEKLGAKVSWHQETQTVFSEYNGSIITTQIGNNLMFVNNAVYTIDVAPTLETDRTMVIPNVFENGMGVKVTWDAENATVIIEK